MLVFSSLVQPDANACRLACLNRQCWIDPADSAELEIDPVVRYFFFGL